MVKNSMETEERERSRLRIQWEISLFHNEESVQDWRKEPKGKYWKGGFHFHDFFFLVCLNTWKCD